VRDLGGDLWDEQLRIRLEGKLIELAFELLAADRSCILDFGLWSREERDALRLRARRLGVRVELHFVDVELAELVHRTAQRYADAPETAPDISPEQMAVWASSFQAPSNASSMRRQHPRSEPPPRPRQADNADGIEHPDTVSWAAVRTTATSHRRRLLGWSAGHLRCTRSRWPHSTLRSRTRSGELAAPAGRPDRNRAACASTSSMTRQRDDDREARSWTAGRAAAPPRSTDRARMKRPLARAHTPPQHP
jgi:hypothetical protein